jgi:hypothetical protein
VRTDFEFAANDLPESRVRAVFRDLGFVVVRAVLPPEEVTRVRAELDVMFEREKLRTLQTLYLPDVFTSAGIWGCLFKASVVTALRAALGPQLCYQNDLDVQRNSFGQAGLKPHKGWHMDAGSETGNPYLRSRDYRFAKCGIFLQDASNGWGGGIMVKPKSHRRFFEANPVRRQVFRFRRAAAVAAARAGLHVDTLHVPSKAGDLCFFDSRLLHSSVLPARANIEQIGYDRKPSLGSFWPDVPRAHTKYVIYWDACNRAMARDFLRNSVRRAGLESVDAHTRPRAAVFSRILSVGYPADYPAEFVATASRLDVSVASLSAEETLFYKHKLQSMQAIHG